MKRNDTFHKMLAEYSPALGDSNQYMRQLTDRLEQIETVKRHYEAERRRWRGRLVVALVSGGLAGVLSTVFFFFHPIIPVRTLHIFHVGTASTLLVSSTIIATPLLIAVMAVGAAVVASLFYRIAKKDFAM